MATGEYAEVLASLYALEAAKGMDFKLERVALALKNLGEPQRQFAAIHIAGTNGKGSVAAMLHAMLGAGGYRVGLYTSPHLVSFTERIRVGAGEISHDAVVELTREIHSAATVRGIDLTFFEFVTVMAFLHFARQDVQVAVVETGLGGRLDATNVLNPEVCVITTIGLDHQEFLGDTLESVAHEKAGIIKPGRPVILGKLPPAARPVLAHAAAERDAAAYWVGRDFQVTDTAPLRFRGMGCAIDEVVVPLRGRYQRDNAAIAIATAVQMRRTFPLADEAIRRGMAAVRWPGRLDVVQAAPLVVLDGAHNADGIETLICELPSLISGRDLHLLFAVMRDKRWQPMVEALGRVATSVTLTTALPRRAEEPANLAAAFGRHCPVRVEPEPVTALETLLQAVNHRDAILVTGSLFLVGALYPYFLRRAGQPSLFGAAAGPLLP